MKKIAIIGAGAAGLMVAATLLEGENMDFTIDIFEKNATPGNKILISGGGRCNVTTAINDLSLLSTKYTRGWKFIKKAISQFSPSHTFRWFESHGVPLKTQDDQRVFPRSDDGSDIVGVFESIFAKNRNKITLHYKEGIKEISQREGIFTLVTEKGTYEADIIVITTGGNAYSHTGSSGDGYAFARALGHTVTPLGPSLSSFLSMEKWLHELSGLALPDARIGDLSGPILLTHFGISGPLAFMYSSKVAWEVISKDQPKYITLAPFSSWSKEIWDDWMREQFQLHPKKNIIPLLSEKLPRRLVEACISEFCPHISLTFLGSIAKKDRETLAKLFGNGIPLTLLERRPGDEFVTAGGVSTDEIDPITFESKIQKNLYFAGEILNVDGYTGGFSLQICWSSGYRAGQGILATLKASGEDSDQIGKNIQVKA